MPSIFISHTSDSRDYARRLREALAEFGEAAFFDEIEITPGESIPDVIRTKLRSADYFVILLTEQAAKSPSVMFEIGAADALGKRVVPILLDDLNIDKLDYLGSDQLFLDARKLKPLQAAQRIKALAEQAK
jgi:nucleoside 2-deoxyribosyltransferase